MPKNIVICCDGTNNKVTLDENTNVVYIYSCLKHNADQIAYYSPGVGTMYPSGLNWAISKWWFRLLDLMSAKTLNDRVRDAYMFLMMNYEEGDKIFLFGFSRGAYTVRMLAGILNMYGLLHKGNYSHVSYIFKDYAQNYTEPLKGQKQVWFNLAFKIKKSFGRPVNVEFVGIWDTVASVGNFTKWYRPFPYTHSLENVSIVRHALAIDEKRKHYIPFRVSSKHKDLKEVWFAGAHSDVGGSYQDDSLAKISLEWMIGEAMKNGLNFDKERIKYYLYGENSRYKKPDCTKQINNSLLKKFMLLDMMPRPSFHPSKGFYLDFRLWPLRKIEDNDTVHKSVFDKIKYTQNGHLYQPKNLNPKITYKVEENLPIL
jgi:uncharacterized protein (DUF2235 family)